MSTTLALMLLVASASGPLPVPLPVAPPPDLLAGDLQLCAAAERAAKPWGYAVGGVAATLAGVGALALAIDWRNDESGGGQGAAMSAADDQGGGEAGNFLIPFILGGLIGGPFLGYQAWDDWADAGAEYRQCTPQMAAAVRASSLGRRFAARAAGAAAFGFHTGLQAGLFLRPGLLLELGGGWQLYRLSASDANERARTKERGDQGWARFGRGRLLAFVGSSLYLAGGVAVRGIDAGDQNYDLRRKDLGVEVGLGSRWYWDTLFFGVDWVSLYVPVATLSRAERDAGGYSSTKDDLRLAEKFVLGPLVNLTLGATF